jgi:predicted enzyme related to lactoylglutathione lyase
MSSRIVHFEIPADNPDRAMAFYQKALGWKYQKYDGPMEYWMVSTGGDGPGIDGGLSKREFPGQGPVVVAGVASIDRSTTAIREAGGEEVVPRVTIPGAGYAAYFKDPEGNVFGIFEADENAA